MLKLERKRKKYIDIITSLLLLKKRDRECLILAELISAYSILQIIPHMRINIFFGFVDSEKKSHGFTVTDTKKHS